MKAVLYLRVSKDDGSQTTDNQRPALGQMAAGRGLQIVREYTDEVSGAKGLRERPGLRALMEDAARGQFRCVLVWALDRFSRDGSFLGGLMMVGELDRYNVALLSHEETYIDTAGPFREPLIALALKLAQQERGKMISRVNAGIARARAAGVKFGRKRREISGPAIVRAHALRTQGLSWESCAKRLQVEGLTKVTMPSATLRRACVTPPKTDGGKAA